MTGVEDLIKGGVRSVLCCDVSTVFSVLSELLLFYFSHTVLTLSRRAKKIIGHYYTHTNVLLCVTVIGVCVELYRDSSAFYCRYAADTHHCVRINIHELLWLICHPFVKIRKT